MDFIRKNVSFCPTKKFAGRVHNKYKKEATNMEGSPKSSADGADSQRQYHITQNKVFGRKNKK